MIGIVKVALTRPLTFIVMAVLILIGGVYAAIRMPVDIFPNIGVPVIAASFQYTGLPPSEMAGRIITPYERVLTTTVDNIEHLEPRRRACPRAAPAPSRRSWGRARRSRSPAPRRAAPCWDWDRT